MYISAFLFANALLRFAWNRSANKFLVFENNPLVFTTKKNRAADEKLNKLVFEYLFRPYNESCIFYISETLNSNCEC